MRLAFRPPNWLGLDVRDGLPGGAAGADLPKAFLRTCLLLLLRERPDHGYDLIRRLEAFGFATNEPGRFYRSLRALERERLVRSTWEHSDSGPERRKYELTREGQEELHRRAERLLAAQSALALFLSRYEEFVGLRPDSEPATRP